MSVLYPNHDDWTNYIFPTDDTYKTCFYCSEPVKPPCINWMGNAEQIFLHRDCAILLASNLQSDAIRYLVNFDINQKLK